MKPCPKDPEGNGYHWWEQDGTNSVNCVYCDAYGVVVMTEEDTDVVDSGFRDTDLLSLRCDDCI